MNVGNYKNNMRLESRISLIESAVFHKESDDQFDQIRKRILDMESERVMKEKDIQMKIEEQK